MKLLLSLSALMLALSLVAQTDIISTRSHSGTVHSNSRLDDGNFGLNEPDFELLRIEYIGNKCVVERKKWYGDNDRITYDTICYNLLFEELDYNEAKIKQYFPNSVKFVGFQKYKREMKAKKQRNELGFPRFLSIIFFSYFGYMFAHELTSKKVKL